MTKEERVALSRDASMLAMGIALDCTGVNQPFDQEKCAKMIQNLLNRNNSRISPDPQRIREEAIKDVMSRIYKLGMFSPKDTHDGVTMRSDEMGLWLNVNAVMEAIRSLLTTKPESRGQPKTKFTHAADAAAALAGDPQVGIEVRNLIEKDLRSELAQHREVNGKLVEALQSVVERGNFMPVANSVFHRCEKALAHAKELEKQLTNPTD